MLNSSIGIIISEVVVCLVLLAFCDILSTIYNHAKNLQTGHLLEFDTLFNYFSVIFLM